MQPRNEFELQMVILNAAMGRRILRQLRGGLAQLACHSPQVVALVMEESRCGVDERLKKTSVGISHLMPQILPHFVGLEELPLVEKRDTLIKPSIPSVKSIHD